MDASWLNVDGLYYSYGACEDDQSFPKDPKDAKYDSNNKAVTLTSYAAYTAKSCPYSSQPDGSEYTGNNDALGAAEKAVVLSLQPDRLAQKLARLVPTVRHIQLQMSRSRRA